MSGTFTTLIKKQVYTLQCSRASEADPKFLNMLTSARKGMGVVMTTPSAMKRVAGWNACSKGV